ADPAQQCLGLAPGIGAPDATDHLRQHDVLDGREFRQEMMKLIDKAERTAPPPGRSNRPATCSIVDLPAPDGPTSATISPGASMRSTPFSTASSTLP